MQVCSKASPWGVRLHLDRDERCRWSVIRSPLGHRTTPRCARFVSHPGASRATSHSGQEQSEQPAGVARQLLLRFRGFIQRAPMQL